MTSDPSRAEALPLILLKDLRNETPLTDYKNSNDFKTSKN